MAKLSPTRPRPAAMTRLVLLLVGEMQDFMYVIGRKLAHREQWKQAWLREVKKDFWGGGNFRGV